MVRRGARLHANQARRQLPEERHHLAASQSFADNNFLLAINAVHVKDILREIQTDCANFLHWTAPLLVVDIQLPLSGT
jgi:hypothetical protein